MTYKICGSSLFRAFTDKSKERIYIESNRNRSVFEVSVSDWDDFMRIVQSTDKYVRKNRGDL